MAVSFDHLMWPAAQIDTPESSHSRSQIHSTVSHNSLPDKLHYTVLYCPCSGKWPNFRQLLLVFAGYNFPTQEVRFLKYRHNSRTNTVKSYGMHSFCVKELYTFKSSRSSEFVQNFQDNVFQRLDNHSSRVHRRTPVEMYHSPRRLPTYRLIISCYK
jgi:hypothetical protein